MHRTIRKSPFEVGYGLQPIGPMELAPHLTIQQFSGDAKVRAKKIKKLHEEVRLKIEKKNAKYVKQPNRRRKYVEFEVGEFVLVHLRSEDLRASLFSQLWVIDAGASINTPNIGNLALIIEELDWRGQDALNTCENSFFLAQGG